MLSFVLLLLFMERIEDIEEERDKFFDIRRMAVGLVRWSCCEREVNSNNFLGQIFTILCADFRAYLFSRTFRFRVFKTLIYGNTNEKQG